MTTFIKEIIFTGFKSFGDQVVAIKLGKGYTCIVGPNGSGKSNIIDGLCFALGRLSKKTMRAENLADLIFVGTKTKKPAKKAKVEVVFDNSENTFQGYIGEDFTISREVSHKGTSVYRINGSRTTRENILMNLSLAGIDPDGFNFILQGKIVELTHMSTEDRRLFIEDLVGLQKFDDEKEKALKELEKADQDLVKFEAIFQEVARQLKAVEKEKNDALRWMELDNKVKELNARLIALNIKKLRDEEEQLLLFIAETKKLIEEISEQIAETENEIDTESNNMNDLTRELESMELNRTDLEEQISVMRSELSSKKTELKLLSENLEKLESRKKNLQEKQEKLEDGQTYQDLLDNAMEKLDQIEIQINKSKTEIQDKENDQKKLENEINIFQQELNGFNKRLNKASSSKSSLSTELKLTKERLVKLESKKGTLEKDLSKLLKDKNENIDEAMAAAQKEAKEINAEIDKIKLELKKETQKQKSFESEIDQLRKQVSKHESQINDYKSKIQVAKSEKEYFDKQIYSIKRDSKTLEVNKVQTNEEIEKYEKEIDKLNGTIGKKTKLLEDLRIERENVEKSLENTQKEYEGVEEEIFGIMNSLEMLTENYSIGISELKADIQADGIDAVDSSMINFRDYILDIIEMIGVVKQLSQEDKYEDLEQAFLSMDMFLENYEVSLNNLKVEIQDHITTLVKNNTSEFTNFIQDLLDILSQVHISLRKLSMTRNTEYINELHELDKKKSRHQDELSDLNVSLTKSEGGFKQASMELKNIQNKLKNYEKELKELTDDIASKDESIDEHNKKIVNLEKDKGELEDKIAEKSKEKDEFWELSQKLNQEIEEKNEVLQEVQDKIRGLETVQKLIRDLEEHETEIEESNQKIETNTEKIEVLDEQIKEIETSRSEKEKEIQELKKRKDEVSQQQKDIRTRLEQENKESQQLQKRKSNISAMILREKEISDINGELEEISTSLEEGEDIIAELKESIEEKDEEKTNVVEKIAELNTKKQEVWERQKALQDELSKQKTNLSTNNNKLSNFKNRKEEIGIRIEELYEESSEFGALPEILEGWTETGIKNDIGKATEEKKILEPVNLKSIEQYDIVKNRFDDIDLRRQSLQRERKAILENIERIELEKTRQFMRAFNEINLHFSEIFTKLSPGGIAKMLLENPAKPFEGGIAIEARPRGKKIKSIDSLSGGEKTLVALSFIFSVERFQPAPFYVMDEIDAALDGPNVHRVSMLIQEFSGDSQFIVISHREENIVNADKIYGVSMKDAITDIFSIKLDEVEDVPTDQSMNELIQSEEG